MKIDFKKEELLKLSKEELIEIIFTLVKHIEKLDKRIEELEEIVKKPKKNSKNSSLPPSSDFKENVKESKNKGGAKKGHEPHFRKLVDKPDRKVFIPIIKCPNCGINHNYKSECHLDHQIIELKSFDFEVIEFQKQKSTCCFGGKSVLAPNPAGVLDNDLFGPRLKSFILISYYENNMSYNKIKRFIETFSGVKIAKRTLINVINKCGKVFQKDHEEIKSHIKNGEVVGIDETGWRVMGEKWWLWVFQNENEVAYQLEKSRGSAVVNKTIGNDYNGTVISDFYSAYENKIVCGSKQKCNSHLLRTLKYVFEVTGQEEGCYADRLKKLIQKAIHLKNSVPFGSEDFIKERIVIEQKLDEYLKEEVNHKEENKIRKRLIKYRQEILLFLYMEKVSPTNNASEQSLRSRVIHRKICNGNRSIEGAESYKINASILETAKKQKRNIFNRLVELLESKNVVVPKLKFSFLNNSIY